MDEPTIAPWERFAALGDPAAMQPLLDGALGRHSRHLEVLDVRMQAGERPSRWPSATVGVSYRVVTDDGTEAVLHGQATADDPASDATIELSPPDRSWVLGLRRFPDDPVLPGLTELYDRSARVAALGVDTTVEVVRHALENHVTARLCDASGEPTAYAKTYRPGRLAAILAGHDAVRRAAPPGWVLGAPLAVFEDTVVHGLAAGRVPTVEMLSGRVAEELMAAAGALLGEIHAVEIEGLPYDDPAARRVEARKKARKLGAALPIAEDGLRSLTATLVDRSAGPRVCLHGDYHPAQVLVDDRRQVTVLDLDSLRWGEAEQDVAEFHVQTCHRGVADDRAIRLTDTAIDAYETRTGRRIGRDRLREHLAVEWITRAYAGHRRLEPGWEAGVLAWLGRWEATERWSG